VITVEQYFGGKPHLMAHTESCVTLLFSVNNLLDEYEHATGYKVPVDPDTGSQISGSKGGAGDGGFRLSTATTGRTGSSHKDAQGVDVFDAENWLDDWLSKYDYDDGKGNTKLEEYGLYREHPNATKGWCHLTTRAPGSGRRTFYP
jgi:hypothetical protein